MGNKESILSEGEKQPPTSKAGTPQQTTFETDFPNLDINIDDYLTDDLSEDGYIDVDTPGDSSDFDNFFEEECTGPDESEEMNMNPTENVPLSVMGFSYADNLNLDGDNTNTGFATESQQSISSLFEEYGEVVPGIGRLEDNRPQTPPQSSQPMSQPLAESQTPTNLEDKENSTMEESAELLFHDFDREDIEMDEQCHEDAADAVIEPNPGGLIDLFKNHQRSSQNDEESCSQNPMKALKEAYPNVSSDLLASMSNLGIPMETLAPAQNNYDLTKLLVSTERVGEDNASDSDSIYGDTINQEPVFIFRGGASISSISNK